MNNIYYSDYENAIRKMYQTRWYTNHGPQAKEFESEVARCCKVKYTVAVSIDILALVICLTGMAEKKLYISGIVNNDVMNAVQISMLKFQFLNSFKNNNNVIICQKLTKNETFILAYEPKDSIIDSVKYNDDDVTDIPVIIYSSAVLQNQYNILPNDNWIKIFPLNSWLNTDANLSGAIIMTNIQNWAHIFSNIRSSYGALKQVDVMSTCNGRFSELQAGLAIIALNNSINSLQSDDK